MLKRLIMLATLGALTGCQTTDTPDFNHLIEAAISDSTRLDEHVARDPDRKPADVIAISGVKPGDIVADIAVAGGYYTAILSRYLGENGKIYAVDPARIFEAFPQAADGFPNYQKKDNRQNVTYSVQKLDEFTTDEPLDHIFMILYYHDTLWTGEDREKMNKAFFQALKPGGSFFIVEHDGEPNAGAEVGKTLHRMDCQLISPEVVKAGFTLESTSDVLENPDDPLNVSVFDAQWRGKTDRCILKFKKPE